MTHRLPNSKFQLVLNTLCHHRGNSPSHAPARANPSCPFVPFVVPYPNNSTSTLSIRQIIFSSSTWSPYTA
jgi:hypothetical protein